MPDIVPEMNAFLNLTLVLGISMYTAVKKRNVIRHCAPSSKADITGVMNSKLKMALSVELSNIDSPLAHIISIGRMSSIAV